MYVIYKNVQVTNKALQSWFIIILDLQLAKMN